MVVHAGGWVTMYAHNSTNFVVAGERVPRGAILAEVGSTGISRGPHVHFELMFSGRNCDPGPLFRPGIRHRNGRLSGVEKVVVDPSWVPSPVSPVCTATSPSSSALGRQRITIQTAFSLF